MIQTQTARNEHGKAVYEIMSDYGGSWLRLYRFVPKENQIQVPTVDSGKGTLCASTKIVADPKEHEFALDYEMTEW